MNVSVKATCPECGTMFQKTNGLQKYCSAKCRNRTNNRKKKLRKSVYYRLIACEAEHGTCELCPYDDCIVN